MPTGHYKRKPLKEETKRKISLANSKPKVNLKCIICSKSFEVIPKRGKIAKYCSNDCKWARKFNAWNAGKTKQTDERVKNYAQTLKNKGVKPSFKGHRHSDKTRQKISANQQGIEIDFWKGYLSPKNKLIRGSLEIKLWREAVFERDNWTCVWCKKRGLYIQADHIKPFAYYPELRFAIDNGRTLCRECHRKTDTFMGRAKKYEKNTRVNGDN